MLSISFRNRIAAYYSITTAVLVAIVFIVIFALVRAGTYRSLDGDLRKEADDLYTEIAADRDGFHVEEEEWHEKEHNTLDINPIFIQFTDSRGRILDRSPNLKKSVLRDAGARNDDYFYDALLDSIRVRQLQVPVRFEGATVGYMLVAVPLEDAAGLVEELGHTLFIAYPLLLLALFSIARLLAGSSIRPVKAITDAARRISSDSLSDRIPYPVHRDELFALSETINGLLDRMEEAVAREKQFTSHASHELRTPVAAVRGTLEVLIRRPRTQEELKEKIGYCIAEMERMGTMVDQLLLLARYEGQKHSARIGETSLNACLLDILSRLSPELKRKEMQVISSLPDGLSVITDEHLLSTALDNILSNAVKYSPQKGRIYVSAVNCEGSILLEIRDEGMGIPDEDLKKVFTPFYRSRPEDHKQAGGSGLGLSIVQRICEMLSIGLELQSEYGKGTKVTLEIPAP